MKRIINGNKIISLYKKTLNKKNNCYEPTHEFIFCVNDQLFVDEEIIAYQADSILISHNKTDHKIVGGKIKTYWDLQLPIKTAFRVVFHKDYGVISFIGTDEMIGSDIYIDRHLRGIGLGTFLFNTVGAWAKENLSPIAKVKSLKLSWVDARDEDNKLRRNKFYRNFGFNLNFEDDEEKHGVARMDKIEDFVVQDKMLNMDQAKTLSDYLSENNLKYYDMADDYNYMKDELEETQQELDKAKDKLRASYGYSLFFALAFVLSAILNLYNLK